MDGDKRFNPYIKVPLEEEIVISGIAGRFPDSDNMYQLRDNLLNEVDMGSEDQRRWKNGLFDLPSRSGIINNIEKFDPQFFDMTHSEANCTDPVCRILLEHTYEAIVDSGINPKKLRGTKTGVFIGACFSTTANMLLFYQNQVTGYPIIGCGKYWLANSISHWLGLCGPSYVVDTACASSFSAITEAYRMIRNGECDAAIVGSAILCLHPKESLQALQFGILSSEGYCKPFDVSGAGYMRSEAATIVYLQKAKNARRNYATLVYAKSNCDGFKEEGITYPSIIMQKNLLQEFYDDCGVTPDKLSYMEAHGTSTFVGDPIEVEAIDQALCSKRTTPLLMGSVKSNLGHAEPNSGLCQVAKILIAMETGIIPPNLHYKTPRKELTAVIEGRIKIVSEPTSWKGGYVGISSFGFGGVNCHILLKSNPKSKISNLGSDGLPRLVLVSGRTKEAVKTLLDDVNSRQLDVEYVALLHYLHAENIEDHPYRGYTIAGTKAARNAINKIGNYSNLKKPICFVFSGTEGTWYNMELIKLPMFARVIEKCDATLKQHGIRVANILTDESETTCGKIVKSFVAIIATQVGIVDLLKHIGIVPDYIIGHSIGNLICEYTDGRFTVEETILMAYYIGIAFEQSKIQLDYTENHSNSLETTRSKFLEAFSRILPPQFSKNHMQDDAPFTVKSTHYMRLGGSDKKRDNMFATMAEYYAESILHPVSLKNIISLVPKDTVLIELVPHDVLHSIMAKSLDSTVTLISLCKHGQKSTMQDFIEGIGDLYNTGLQPQIANLYPPMHFPVTRGTPMISPLVKWDHSEDYHFYHYKGPEKIFSKERTVTITTTDEEFEYMSGHVIDGKNLLPSTGYLHLIWHMISLLTGIDHCELPIVFENVKFLRATYLSKRQNVKLTLMIQEEGGNNFEIIEGGNVIVSGNVRVPDDITSEKLPVQFLCKMKDYTEEYMSTADIYKELRLRGYQYTGIFRLLKSVSITGRVGCIKWPANWAAFMDNMLQIKVLSLDMRSLCIPTQIRKLVIDPKYHMMQLQNREIEERDLPVHIYDSLDAVVSGGIEICGLQTATISRRPTTTEAVHEEYGFVAHHDRVTVSLKESVRVSVHIALECHESINVKMMEYVGDNGVILPEDLITPIIQQVLDNTPLVRPNLTLATANNRLDRTSLPPNLSIVQLDKLAKDAFLLAVGVGILTKGIRDSTDRLLSGIIAGGFLLSREDLNVTHDYALLRRYNLNIVLEKRTQRETLVLLRKARNIVIRREIVRISNHEFSWIDELKSAMDVGMKSRENMRVIIVAQGDFECGVLGLVNCLRKEPGGEMIRCVFIQDKDAPEFSLQHPLYMDQLQLDLTINVLRPGNVWGTYRHLSLPLLEPRAVQYGYVVQMLLGNMSTFRWVEGRISPHIERENLIRIVYATLNFKDVIIASGKLAQESLGSVGREVDSLLGSEFAGFDGTGRRIMGICANRAISSLLMHDDALFWAIPNEWTYDQAATVPCAYAICCYALYVRGKMKKGDKVLIHSGTGGVGQAAINLALHEGCEVFTTVGTPRKRQFIRDTFPSVPDDHIGNSRDTSFEQLIMQRTQGRGVDIALNSLAEEKFQASVRCLAGGGRFLEIGKYDLISDNILDKTAFAKGISFHKVMLDSLMLGENESKRNLWDCVSQCLRKGAIKPLSRKVYDKTEVESAFRYMAAGKHMGKILIKIRDENEPLDSPILAQPRFFCESYKSYVIMGGLGGFGLELADWLILRGARKLLLISRTGMRNGYQRSRVELWRSNYGVNVQIIAGADACDHKDCAFILNSAAKMGPVDAVFNVAVVLKDSLYKDQTAESFEVAFKPKAMATKTLDQLSRRMCPDLRHFVVFSSLSCGRGNVGQTNYGMANSIMERICEKRAQEGFPGMAIQWAPLGDVGLIADMQQDYKELIVCGALQQRIQSCLQSLDVFLVQSRPIVCSTVVADKQTGLNGEMGILKIVANIMGLKNLKTIGHHTRLSEIGVDSMMATEITQTLKREFDVCLTEQDIGNQTFANLCDIINKG